MNISSYWLLPVITFVVGVIGTIIVSIIANLLTPDRETLINRYKNWQAKKSARAAKSRIQELELEREIVEDFTNAKSKFVLFLASQLFSSLMYFMQGIFGFSMYVFLQTIITQMLSYPSQVLPIVCTFVFALLVFWSAIRCLIIVDEAIKVIANVRDYSSYKLRTQQMIEDLQRVAGIEIKT